MYKVIFTDGTLMEGVNLKWLYHLAESDKRAARYYGQGQPGYKLLNRDGKVILEVKAGKVTSLETWIG